MNRSRFSEEQFIGILAEQESGMKVSEVSRKSLLCRARRKKLTIVDGLPPIDDATEPTIGYRIDPDEAFRTPQRIWLPIPADTNPADLVLMYYKGTVPNQGWHKAENIEGFLANDESIIADGFYGVVVNHAGTVALEVRR